MLLSNFLALSRKRFNFIHITTMPSKRKSSEKSGGRASKKQKTDSKTNVKSQPMKEEPPKPPFSHWLVKSEPGSRIEKGIDMKFSFDDLIESPGQTSCWDGVRNYQARNFLRDQMKLDHDLFFYHSNCKEPGIVGICKVVKEGYPDFTQFDSKNPHYDGASKKDNPRWFMVDVKYVRPLTRFISLASLKKIHHKHLATGGPLKNLSLFTRARLSVQPISKEEWNFILSLEEEED